ncbi:MAG: anthranilate synthase component I [Polyangiales bacterium]
MSESCSTVSQYHTETGIKITRSTRAAGPDAIAELARQLDVRRGLLLASSYEYPGRYKRHDIGFVDPPLVFESSERSFALEALNSRGEVLLAACAVAVAACPAVVDHHVQATRITGEVAPREDVVPEEQRTRSASIFSVVRALLAMFASPHDARLGLYGAFGYDLVFQLDCLQKRLPRAKSSRELVLYLPDALLVLDHAVQSAVYYDYELEYAGRSTLGLPRDPVFTGPPPLPLTAAIHLPERDHAPGEYARLVERARDAFAAGDLFEVTPSQLFLEPCAAAPSHVFETLRQQNPAPYGFYTNLGADERLIGASPEMYVRVTEGRVETCPIAGTIARGDDACGDAEQILRLLSSEKEAAELTMCTDVDRNDKARICEHGSVRVIGRRQIEVYSRLIHTVDHVEGRLRPGYDAVDALLTHMWSVTVTGAPKLDAMQFIEDHEKSPREYYGGAIGALRFDGSLDTGLILRTLHLKGQKAQIRAGATLHFDSEPEAEERESELKASALFRALAVAAHSGGSKGRASRAAVGPGASLRVLMIDHRDSFVHTLGDYFRQVGCEVTTLRFGFDPARYAALDPQLVVLSPGPGRPAAFGMDATLRELCARGLPVFGVCLGLQGMVEFCGGQLGQLPTPVHGKASLIRCQPHALFAGLPSQLEVGRYHSLHARHDQLPSELVALAHAEADGCIMAVAHRKHPWTAVQFHPESILSTGGQHGLRLIENVVALARREPAQQRALG